MFWLYGSSPIWLATIAMFVNDDGDPDYWATAPWLLVMAIPITGGAFAVAGVARLLYLRTPGSEAKRLTFTYLLLAIAPFLFLGYLYAKAHIL